MRHVRIARWSRVFGAACVALALAGCVEQAAELSPNLARAAIERRPGVEIAAATVSIVSIAGAPDSLTASFTQAVQREGRAREIAFLDDGKARYLVRGYLSAAATANGAAFEYVWDIFGPDKRRAARLNDVIAVQGSVSDDPWSLATPAAMESIAAKSADDLAAFLSNTPDARPVALGASPALGYAPVE